AATDTHACRDPPGAAGDDRRPPDRRRLDCRDRDDRGLDRRERPRRADLLRDSAPDAVQDRDLLRRFPGRRTGTALRPPPRGHTAARGALEQGGLVIFDAANAHTVVEAFRFIADNPQLLLTKAWEQLELSGAALGLALLVALPLGIVLGHLHRGSGVAIG